MLVFIMDNEKVVGTDQNFFEGTLVDAMKDAQATEDDKMQVRSYVVATWTGATCIRSICDTVGTKFEWSQLLRDH